MFNLNRVSYFSVLVAGVVLVAFMACTDPVSVEDPPEEEEFRMVSYELGAVQNDGSLSDGVSATATFRELRDGFTLITLELDDGSTETDSIHTAHIHENSAEEGGDIALFLSPIDGLAGSPGTSHTVTDWSFDQLVDYDGYINIHESNVELDKIVSQGNIGANAAAEVMESDITPIEDRQVATYELDGVENDGILSDGVAATAQFHELTATQTLVTLELDGGSTETGISHSTHIHENSAEEGGDIVFFLSAIDGLTGSPGSSATLIDESFDTMTNFDGYINIHESNENLGNVFSQGNIGANADAGSGDGGGNGY